MIQSCLDHFVVSTNMCTLTETHCSEANVNSCQPSTRTEFLWLSSNQTNFNSEFKHGNTYRPLSSYQKHGATLTRPACDYQVEIHNHMWMRIQSPNKRVCWVIKKKKTKKIRGGKPFPNIFLPLICLNKQIKKACSNNSCYSW